MITSLEFDFFSKCFQYIFIFAFIEFVVYVDVFKYDFVSFSAT